ncbi:TfuA domain-containing protein [Streptomyces sp. NPDC048251]|uniref:TfuA domain-containing protein n=1 Tax=Streptomyces sp. NPDC048251 TaxID=3154501 RepID=UPI00342E56BB
MIHVFVGPTLTRCEPQLAAPRVQVWPPVGHGGLFDAAIRSGDTAVIIDGVYHQAPALRHKEILAAVGRGVRVVGAASIGALRAAELADFGMLGVGRVYAAYVRGEIDGDDEVAVGQAPDGEFAALTWPVVNLRSVLQLARSAGVLDVVRADRLLACLRAIYYPQRTWAAVRAVCRRQGESEFADWLARQRMQDEHFGDVKRADALAAISAALDDGPVQQAAAPLTPPLWETTYFRRWSNSFARTVVDGLELSTEDRLVYQQVFDPEFRTTWAAYLEHRSLHPTGGRPGLPLAERLAQVTGSGMPADRVFHPAVDLRDEETVSLLLAGETDLDRQAVAQYADVLARARASRAGFQTAAVRDDLALQLLLQVWRCPEEELDAEASARGLVCAARAVAEAKRLVPALFQEKVEMTDGTEAAGVTR